MMNTNILDRANAAIARKQVDASCPKGTASVRTAHGDYYEVDGRIFNDIHGNKLIVWRHPACKWSVACVESGMIVTLCNATRSDAMIEAQRIMGAL